MKKNYIIAIDGPAASGKSTTAKLLAKKLKYIYIDTGAMYRACALDALNNGVSLKDTKNLKKLIDKIKIEIQYSENGNNIYLHNKNVTERIRESDISKLSSEIAVIDFVREKMVQLQREIGKKGGIIMDGRDIGTVVFPNADFKFFMIADVDNRVKRRLKELLEKGIQTDFDTVKKEMIWRDKNDSTRKNSPLRKAEDAIEIDTSDMTINQQVEAIYNIIKEGKN